MFTDLEHTRAHHDERLRSALEHRRQLRLLAVRRAQRRAERAACRAREAALQASLAATNMW